MTFDTYCMKDGELICSGTEQGITASVKGYVWIRLLRAKIIGVLQSGIRKCFIYHQTGQERRITL